MRTIYFWLRYTFPLALLFYPETLALRLQYFNSYFWATSRFSSLNPLTFWNVKSFSTFPLLAPVTLHQLKSPCFSLYSSDLAHLQLVTSWTSLVLRSDLGEKGWEGRRSQTLGRWLELHILHLLQSVLGSERARQDGGQCGNLGDLGARDQF